MRALNCQSVCGLIEEMELDGQPSAQLEKHIESCDACNAFYLDRVKLRRMIGDVERIEAPSDFDFRLRARLAGERASSYPSLMSRVSLRSAALAALALILVGAVSYRALFKTAAPVAQVQPTATTADSYKSAASNVALAQANANNQIENGERQSSISPPAASNPSKRKPIKQNVQRNLVARRNQITTRDFSTTAASVIKPDDRMIGDGSPIFAIDASNQNMKLSLDDSSGGIRHISVPRVSFGSQRVLAGETTSMVKTSARGDW